MRKIRGFRIQKFSELSDNFVVEKDLDLKRYLEIEDELEAKSSEFNLYDDEALLLSDLEELLRIAKEDPGSLSPFEILPLLIDLLIRFAQSFKEGFPFFTSLNPDVIEQKVQWGLEYPSLGPFVSEFRVPKDAKDELGNQPMQKKFHRVPFVQSDEIADYLLDIVDILGVVWRTKKVPRILSQKYLLDTIVSQKEIIKSYREKVANLEKQISRQSYLQRKNRKN